MIDTTKSLTGVSYNGSAITIETPSTLKNMFDIIKTLGGSSNSGQGLFSNNTTLTSQQLSDILAYSDTENVTNATYAFMGSSNLTTIPLIDTSSVTDMTYMFNSCTNLSSIPQLNTSNVTKMQAMFGGCSHLTTLPLLDTSSVTDMQNMFYYASGLTVVPAFNVSSVTGFSNMFYRCSNIEEIHMYGMSRDFNISSSTKFTENALVEILNNLATVATTRTLTMGSTNLAKLTEAEKAIATNKGWTLA